MLRPFMAIILGATMLIFLLPDITKLLKRRPVYLVPFIGIGTVLLTVLVLLTKRKFETYFTFIEYTTVGDGALSHIEDVSKGYSTGNTLIDFCISSFRYILTPIPFSVMNRLFIGGSVMWGITDDTVLLINQLIYYILLIYALFNIKRFKKTLKLIINDKALALLITTFLAFWPIYSFHLYGVTHQRLKVPFQMAVFLFCLFIWKEKRGEK